jgi:type VI secretion system secreted protein VgrG
VLLVIGTQADAAIVPTVPLSSSANYSVLAGSTVTNTGNSVLNRGLGLHPGTSITGFPPGLVQGTVDATNAVALQAKNDLTTAYNNAAGRSLTASTEADLANKTLPGGVYAASSKGSLLLNGTLTLDGEGNPNSVFIFQTDSTLTTGSGSNVSLINGAQECNVFWQIGSSATLGSGSVFAGNILAQTSITVTSSVTVHGRALAQTGAVTLDNDTFTGPTCNLSAAPAAPAATVAGGGAGTVAGGGSADTVPAGSATTVAPGVTSTTVHLPGTGTAVRTNVLVGIAALALGAAAVALARRKQVPIR